MPEWLGGHVSSCWDHKARANTPGKGWHCGAAGQAATVTLAHHTGARAQFLATLLPIQANLPTLWGNSRQWCQCVGPIPALLAGVIGFWLQPRPGLAAVVIWGSEPVDEKALCNPCHSAFQIKKKILKNFWVISMKISQSYKWVITNSCNEFL